MVFRVFFGILVVVGALLYLSFLNPDTLTLHLAPGVSFPIYTSLLILTSVLLGAFLMLCVTVLRDTRRGFLLWREKARLRDRERIMDLYRSGVDALLSKKREEALSCFGRILDKDPDHVDALLRMGEVHRYKGDFDRAVQYHGRARALAPDNPSVLFALAKDLRRAGRAAEAAEIYEQILSKDPRNTGAFLKLRELREKQGEWEAAAALQKDHADVKHDPAEKKRYLHYRYMAAAALGPDKAAQKIKLLAEVIKAGPSMVAPYLELARTHAGRGEDREAVKVLQRGIRESGHPALIQALGEHFLEREDPAAAIAVYREAVQRRPQNPVYRFLLGMIHYRLEMIDDAREIFEQLLQDGVDLALVRQILGDIYQKRGLLEEALREYQTSVRFTRPLAVPYRCTACGRGEEAWIPRCPGCGEIETLAVPVRPASVPAAPARA